LDHSFHELVDHNLNIDSLKIKASYLQ